MATMQQRGKCWVIRATVNGVRHPVGIGRIGEDAAEQVKGWVTRLEECRKRGLSLGVDERAWLAGIGDDLHGRLAAIGLAESRVPVVEAKRYTVAELIETFKAREPAAKASTAAAREQAYKSLREHFTGRRTIDSIKAGDIDGWFAEQLRTKARATAGKRGKVVKRMFDRAVRWEMLARSPAAHLRLPEQKNDARQAFVEWSDIERVIAGAPDAEWKLIIALSRLAGLRIPSEILVLEWRDVDFANNIITIRANKTKARACPIFPELLPYLQDHFDATPAGETRVIHRHRLAGGNYATEFKRFIVKAGVKVWPRLWHNLRASRATELAGAYPGHVAAAWLGHSEKIADRHYRTVRLEDFNKAANTPTLATVGGRHVGQKGEKLSASEDKYSVDVTQSYPGKNEKTPAKAGVSGLSGSKNQWAVRDSNYLENTSEFEELSAELSYMLARADFDPKLLEIIDAWPILPLETQRVINMLIDMWTARIGA